MHKGLYRFLLIFVVFGLCAAFVPTQVALADTFQAGDVFVSLNGGLVEWHRGDGTLVRTINLGDPGTAFGLAFDSIGNLYVTQIVANGFAKGRILKFNSAGTLLNSNWGNPVFPGGTSSYNCL